MIFSLNIKRAHHYLLSLSSNQIETSVIHFMHHYVKLESKGLFKIDNRTFLKVNILNTRLIDDLMQNEIF